MRFEWDEFKNQTNVEKHGISFDDAKHIFEGPVLTRLDSRRDYGEDRYVSIGQLQPGVLMVVVHTRRDDRVRLISARSASRAERRSYHEKI